MKQNRFLTVVFLALLAGVSSGGESPVGRRPSRIASLLPSHTDILAVLGILDRVVAVSVAEDPLLYPGLPRVGGMEIAWEPLVKLQPDLVLADVSHRRFDVQFKKFRLPVVYLPATEADTVEKILDLVREVGHLTGEGERASRWVKGAERRAALLEARRLPGPGPLVYFEVWPHPLQAFGPRSLPGHLLERVGARNVATEPGQAVPLMSAEALVRADPEVILHTGVISGAAIAGRPGWSSIKAVQEKRILILSRDDFSRAGPRVLDAWEKLADILGARAP